MLLLRYICVLFPILATQSYVLNKSPDSSIAAIDTSLTTSAHATIVKSETQALAVRGRASWGFPGLAKTFLTTVTLVINAAILTAACGASPVSCGAAAIYAAFTFYFVAFRSVLDSRSIDGDQNFYRYPALEDTPHLERLKAELEPGVWHNIGWSHTSGSNHTMLYFNHGTHHSIRAWQQSSNHDAINATQFAKRQNAAQDNSGGMVVDYIWQDRSTQAYNDFHSTDDATHFYADNVGGYLIGSQQSIAACTDFEDQDGKLDNGLLTIGWNNQPFEFTEDGEENGILSECDSDI